MNLTKWNKFIKESIKDPRFDLELDDSPTPSTPSKRGSAFPDPTPYNSPKPYWHEFDQRRYIPTERSLKTVEENLMKEVKGQKFLKRLFNRCLVNLSELTLVNMEEASRDNGFFSCMISNYNDGEVLVYLSDVAEDAIIGFEGQPTYTPYKFNSDWALGVGEAFDAVYENYPEDEADSLLAYFHRTYLKVVVQNYSLFKKDTVENSNELEYYKDDEIPKNDPIKQYNNFLQKIKNGPNSNSEQDNRFKNLELDESFNKLELKTNNDQKNEYKIKPIEPIKLRKKKFSFIEFGKKFTQEEWSTGDPENEYNHREDGPAIIVSDENGKIIKEEWFQYGKKYRENNKPAIVEYYENGNLKSQTWYINGKISNLTAPAQIKYYSSGKKWEERWLKNGKLHRENGPAFIEYLSNGEIDFEEYYENGNRIND